MNGANRASGTNETVGAIETSKVNGANRVFRMKKEAINIKKVVAFSIHVPQQNEVK